MDLDRQLITEARQLITGANIHAIGGLILSHESIPPGSAKSRKLEALLRDVVSISIRRDTLQREIETQQTQLKTLNTISGSLNRTIEKYLTSSSE